MDKKGFLIGVLGKQKRIFSRASAHTRKDLVVTQDGNREWITVLACVCADGIACPPALVYEAVSGDLQDTWVQDFLFKKDEIFLTSSPSRWTSNKVGLAWIRDVF